jgi:hypothetical protein
MTHPFNCTVGLTNKAAVSLLVRSLSDLQSMRDENEVLLMDHACEEMFSQSLGEMSRAIKHLATIIGTKESAADIREAS